MIQRRCLQLVAALFAAGFVFVTEVPAFETPCAVHDPALARLATMDGHAHGSVHLLTHNHGAPAQGSHVPTKSDKTHGQKSHGCTCVGCGNCTSSFTLAAASLTFAPAIVAAGTDAPLPPIEKHACSIPEHARPFSTAPPDLIG